MSWLYSRVLVEEFLGDISLDGEQSVQSNGSNTQLAYCAPDKMTDFSRLSRFGMTYKTLTENRGEELLTLYRAAFLAKTLVQQGEEQGLAENEAVCGEKWHASFTKYDPDTSLWKTHQCSLLGDLEEFSETWPQWGLMRDGECWEQRTLEQTIRGTEYGLSPNGVDSFHTPNTTGLDGGSNSRKALKKRKEEAKFPTPTASDWMSPKQNGIDLVNNRYVRTSLTTGVKFGAKLSDAINLDMKKKFPTPQASDNRDRGNMSNAVVQRRIAIGKQVLLSQSVHPTSGQLNPTWVEWLMGWPLEWTDLKPLEMDKSLSAQQQPGEF
jgi:DNA (cytosine-5)-methyltransferase 1